METRTISKVSEEIASLGHMEARILNLVKERRTLPLEEATLQMEEARNLISSCHLGLLGAEYPWGVEFELGLSKKGADYLATALPVDSTLLGQEKTTA